MVGYRRALSVRKGHDKNRYMKPDGLKSPVFQSSTHTNISLHIQDSPVAWLSDGTMVNVTINGGHRSYSDLNVRQIIQNAVDDHGHTASLTPILTVSHEYLQLHGLWDNRIQLSGRTVSDNGKRVEYVHPPIIGKNLVDINIAQKIDIAKVPKKFILIICPFNEWLLEGKIPPDVFPISLSHDIGCDDCILLMIASNTQDSTSVPEEALWDEDFINTIPRCFRNNALCQGNKKKHYDSMGKYFGLGIAAKYEKNSANASYGQIVSNKRASTDDIVSAKNILTQDLKFVSSQIDDIIPGICSSGNSIVKTIMNMSDDLCHSMNNDYHKFIKIDDINEGFVTGFVCKNAQTRCVHREKDCAYTLIAIPFCTTDILNVGHFVFEFVWRVETYHEELTQIQIQLTPGTVIYYTGFGLMHRQISLTDNASSNKDYNFWNLSFYGNQRLYWNAIATFRRISELNK